MFDRLSVVMPAKNEAGGLRKFLPQLLKKVPGAEIILVDDGSTDATKEIAEQYGVVVISHRYSMGNGAAIKTGAKAATRDAILFMDADGQHSPESIDAVIEKYFSGFDLVVGARKREGQAGIGRAFGNYLYNKLASWMTGHQVKDLTSGFRIVDREKFLEVIHLLPNGFSYPTTSTMAFYRNGYSVHFEPIKVMPRVGESHLKIWSDGIKFLLIIFKVATLYSPLKIFFPLSLLFFVCGAGYYCYTYLSDGRFTNMGGLLFMTSILIFLIGLVSEQITVLIYKR